VEEEEVDIAWPDLQLSLRDATAAASGLNHPSDTAF